MRSIPPRGVVSDPIVYYRKLGRHMYQLESDFVVQTRIFPTKIVQTKFLILTTHGVLIMRQGYVSDGPSGPTFDTKSSMRGGFVHDGGYRLMRRGLIHINWRKDWDDEIHDLCIEDKMYVWRANMWYWALRLKGEINALPVSVCPVLSAPYQKVKETIG